MIFCRIHLYIFEGEVYKVVGNRSQREYEVAFLE